MVDASNAMPAETVDPTSLPQPAARLRKAGVREIMLVHGTFAGDDITGLMRGLSRFSPKWSGMLRELGKRWFDQLADEVGNYTDDYACRLRELVRVEEADRQAPSPEIAVSRFHWSGENHHLGRACAVMTLLGRIIRSGWSADDRILWLTHSHGGNVLAMATLLLGASRPAKEAFLSAIAGHQPSDRSDSTEPQADWGEVAELLLAHQPTMGLPKFDIATFGTPLRYRWDRGSCGRLMHFVQHRPQNKDEPWRAQMPRSPQDLLHAVGGDYVQHFGIGGTDFFHSPFALRSWRSERQLRRIFEPRVRRRDLRRNLHQGWRVSQDGKTWLVDYGRGDQPWNEKLLGHGCYTCHQWLPFHLEQITSEFYP